MQRGVQFIMSGVAAKMLVKFGLMQDGCSFDSDHYSAVHDLNLVVQGLFSKASDHWDQVKKLMTKRKGLNQSVKLRFKTPLRLVLSQAARGSSTFAMVHRYFRLLEIISDDGTLADFLPGPAANRRLRKFLDDISKIDSVSKELQSSSVMLGCIWTDYWSYTRPLARIVLSSPFEATCVKVLAGKADELSRAEATSLRPLVVETMS
ncbi:hypothetical protein JG688_00015243 [Phytophthora aleatoria]|uniref:Uncharacterized protein n=1 Tax=Phytophthora aleatoria TaxID=2496075 RepID=A0A8J5IVY6_9STRA|nr:hypothetical protein JG688_00015243 [Phytophthora aleatoria]